VLSHHPSARYSSACMSARLLICSSYMVPQRADAVWQESLLPWLTAIATPAQKGKADLEESWRGLIGDELAVLLNSASTIWSASASADTGG
jgi:hypothetical protein